MVALGTSRKRLGAEVLGFLKMRGPLLAKEASPRLDGTELGLDRGWQLTLGVRSWVIEGGAERNASIKASR